MIVNEFKPCCRECGEIDIDYESESAKYANGESTAFSKIYCRHQTVCKKYIECDEKPNEI